MNSESLPGLALRSARPPDLEGYLVSYGLVSSYSQVYLLLTISCSCSHSFIQVRKEFGQDISSLERSVRGFELISNKTEKASVYSFRRIQYIVIENTHFVFLLIVCSQGLIEKWWFTRLASKGLLGLSDDERIKIRSCLKLSVLRQLDGQIDTPLYMLKGQSKHDELGFVDRTFGTTTSSSKAKVFERHSSSP